MDFFLLVLTLYMYQLLRSFASLLCLLLQVSYLVKDFHYSARAFIIVSRELHPKMTALKFHYSFTYT